MPILIDRKSSENLALQFAEALELVRNEFEGLDPHRQYRNAFARLLERIRLGVAVTATATARRIFSQANWLRRNWHAVLRQWPRPHSL